MLSLDRSQEVAMQGRGFEETQSQYAADDPCALIGQVRRWGAAGPAYEIIGIDEGGNAVCEVIYSGEKVTCPIAEVLDDPMAETIP
jgi:hypothetical protein